MQRTRRDQAQHQLFILLGLAVHDTPTRMIGTDPQRRGLDLVDRQAAGLVRATTINWHARHALATSLGKDGDVADRLLVLIDNQHREQVRRSQLDRALAVFFVEVHTFDTGRQAFDVGEHSVVTLIEAGHLPDAVLNLLHAVLEIDGLRETQHEHFRGALTVLTRQQTETRVLDRSTVRHLHVDRDRILCRQRDDHIGDDRLRFGQHPRVVVRAACSNSNFARREAHAVDLALFVGLAEVAS